MKTLVAGHTGLVGSAIYEHLLSQGFEVIGVNSKLLDLLDRKKTFDFVNDVQPDVVVDAAAVVGGIAANNSKPVEFLSSNLQIQTNLMDAAHEAKVKKFVFLGSSCIYPRECMQPIKENYFLTGPLESTNSAYAVAKIAGIELIKSYRKEFGHKWISLMPTNMYGPRDNFSLKSGHVLPALIHRFILAKEEQRGTITLWGTGKPRREFLHSHDLATAVISALEKYDEDIHLNVGTGLDIPINDLAELVAQEVGFNGEIVWDASMPDGTMRKVLDVSRIKSLGWSPKIELRDGIRSTVEWFLENREFAKK